eukprot:scaffold870_cov393-Prasinococcus_capsulatus_cf.AAC.31
MRRTLVSEAWSRTQHQASRLSSCWHHHKIADLVAAGLPLGAAICMKPTTESREVCRSSPSRRAIGEERRSRPALVSCAAQL